MAVDSQSTDLRLHRKYVLVTCFILLFLKAGGVFIKQVSFLGTVLTFDNKEIIYTALWVLLFYSFLRYWQYFIEEIQKSLTEEFIILRNDTIDHYLDSNARKQCEASLSVNPKNLSLPHISYTELSRGKGKNFLTLYKEIRVSELKDNARWGEKSSIEKKHNITIRFNDITNFWKYHLLTWSLFIFKKPSFFEFLFPYLLMLFTLALCGFSDWQGSILYIFGYRFHPANEIDAFSQWWPH